MNKIDELLKNIESLDDAKRIEALTDRLYSMQGVMDAIDKALLGDNSPGGEGVQRFSRGFIHASRAIAIKNIHAALAKAEAEVARLQGQ